MEEVEEVAGCRLTVADVVCGAAADDGLAAPLDRDTLALDTGRTGVVHLLAEEPTPAVRADARIELLHFAPPAMRSMRSLVPIVHGRAGRR